MSLETSPTTKPLQQTNLNYVQSFDLRLSQQDLLANNAVHSIPPCWACRPQGDHLGTNH